MTNQSLKGALTGEGMPVIRCEMLAGIEDKFNRELIENGIGVADYGVGASAEVNEENGENTGPATRSLDVLRRVTRTGAYGVLTRDKHRHLAVGVATPACGLFLEAPMRNSNSNVMLKGFQFDRFAVISPENQPDIQEVIKDVLDRYPQQTLTTIDKDVNRDTIYDAIHKLERRGHLSRPPLYHA